MQLTSCTGDGTYRLYGNDSEERQRGTFEEMRADELITRYRDGYMVCILPDGSDLSTRLGPAITTMATENPRARQRAAARADAAGDRRPAPPFVRGGQSQLTGWLQPSR